MVFKEITKKKSIALLLKHIIHKRLHIEIDNLEKSNSGTKPRQI